jgi:hypothetical protein
MGAQGCAGTLVCNGAGTGTTCNAPTKNACNVCGGPPVSGVGASCVNAAGCAGTFVCTAAGTGVECQGPMKNACNVCGGPTVSGVGSACTGANGCAGTLACNGAGTGTTCTAPTKNACDVCGGPTITGLGQSCSGPTGCPGMNVCNTTGTAATCNAPSMCAVGSSLLISQVSGQVTAGDQFDEFIELYNPTTAPLNVTGYRLWYRSASSTGTWNSLTALSGTVPARSYLLVAYGATPGVFAAKHGGFAPEASYTSASMSANDGQVLLWKDASVPPTGDAFLTSPLKSDFVGFGSAVRFEGHPTGSGAPTPGSTRSLVRKANPSSTSTSMATTEATAGNRTDTDVNSADFVTLTTPVLRNSTTPPTP